MTDQLTTADVARLAGVAPASIRTYRGRGVIPQPDGYLGSTPWWHRSTIDAWLAGRPKRGRPNATKPPAPAPEGTETGG